MPAIFLVGFMGSGKSTIGLLLAKRLAWTFRDLDAIIEAEQGLTIANIFDTRGEAGFRAIEGAALAAQVEAPALKGANFVLALGGGAFAQPANRALLAGHATVWLDCPFERVRARVGTDPQRPLARDPAKFERLFTERSAAYAKARHRVEVLSDDPGPAVEAILALALTGEGSHPESAPKF